MNPNEKILVLLITNFRGLIPQRIMDWDGYDLTQIKNYLEQAGLEIQILGAHEISNSLIRNRKHVVALYASSQDSRYKQYLQDIIANLHFTGVILFPAFEHMLAHEDKAFQAIRLSSTEISSPRSFVFGNEQQAYEFLKKATFPMVGKTVEGFGSKGVCLIENIRMGQKFIAKQMIHRALKKGRPWYQRAFQRIFKPSPVLGILLFQELIPDLSGDWKILIWGDTACGIYRKNRQNDFRASGSGNVFFIDIPVDVLNFARDVLDKLNLPWASLDIGYNGNQCYLLEYQAIHFGLTTADKGIFYYTRNSEGVWIKRQGRIQIEIEIAKIIISSLEKQGYMIK